MIPPEERRHLLEGPREDETPGGAGLAEVVAESSAGIGGVLTWARAVLRVVVEGSGPEWPSGGAWAAMLAGWFVQGCADEPSAEEAAVWLAWWRGLDPDAGARRPGRAVEPGGLALLDAGRGAHLVLVGRRGARGGERDLVLAWPSTAELFSLLLQKQEVLLDGTWLCDVGFLARDPVVPYLKWGASMYVMEGPKVVGFATVRDVDTDTLFAGDRLVTNRVSGDHPTFCDAGDPL